MKRDIIICIIVIIFVIILNTITARYTKNSAIMIGDKLNEIKEKIKQEKNKSEIYNDIQKLKENWEERNDKLAYYIEHDELEKVHLYIVGLESSLESEEYGEAIEELDKCKFILKHIEEKYSFSMKNIF